MDKKIGLLAAISVIAVMSSGCSSFRGSSQGGYGDDAYGSGSSQTARTGQVAGGGQVAGSGQVANDDVSGNGRRNRWFGQQYRDTSAATCKPCATAPKPAAQNTYTYRPAPKPKTVYRPPAKPAGEHNQQWYIDRWNRQQQQQVKKPATTTTNTSTYSGYGSGNYDAGNQGSSTYYDYSSASGGKSNTSAATSNKSIYTGSYQQKTYKPYNPTTYAGGSAATTTSGSSTPVVSSGGSTYTVRKGDTVFEIMRQTGVYWKDIIRLNDLQPPYSISPGQTIRLK